MAKSKKSTQGRQNGSADVEKQSRRQIKAVADKHSHSPDLQAIFGLTSKDTQQLEALPSPVCWCCHIEECFDSLLTDQYAPIWTALGYVRPKKAAECWKLLRAVSEALTKLDDPDHSIEDLAAKVRISPETVLGASPGQPAASAPAIDCNDQCMVVIFAMVCWYTMILQPELSCTAPASSPRLVVRQPNAEPLSLKINFVRRPMSVVFRNFQKASCRGRLPLKPEKADSAILYVSTINFHSLRTIGKVSLQWVDDLSSHMSFDRRARKLSVFRWPSFCAYRNATSNGGVLLEELVRASFLSHEESQRDEDLGSTQLIQEVLMSYRLLFGQSYASRALAKSLIHELEKHGRVDGLLGYLCTKPQKDVNRRLPSSCWPVTCRDFDGNLQEAGCYSAQDDFPLLGNRLVALQEFGLRQQPSRLRDLWRDRRSPLQWYTFWAVLVFGGISNIVAILQLFVAILQLLSSRIVPQPS